MTNRGNNDNDRAKNARKGNPAQGQKKERKMRPLAANSDSVSTRRRHESLSPAVQARIGQGLKALFDEIAHEPIPDDLLRLLERLEAENGKKPK